MCTETSFEDIRSLQEISKKVLSKLPDDDALDRVEDHNHAFSMAKFYIRQGRMAIQLLANCFEAGRMDTEEACAAHTLLIQSEQMLGAAISEAAPGGPSCIGKCASEKSACKATCEKKFCGCTWNAFLCKSNCFLRIEINISP